MAGNGGALPLIEAKETVGSPCRHSAMDKSVHMGQAAQTGVVAEKLFVGFAAPVVAKKVVEQGGPGNGFHPVLPHAETAGQPIGAFRGIHRVVVQGVFTPMMNKSLHLGK